MLRRRLTRTIALGFAAWGSALAGGAAPALAACEPQPMTRAFLPFADPAHYWPAPGGDFEHGLGGWTPQGDATVVGGNEPFGIAPGSSALRLGRGASVTSPPMCIDLAHPAFRFVSKPEGLGVLAAVLESRRDGGPWLEVLSLASPGVRGLPWAPALPHPLVGGLPIGRDGTAELRIRLTAVGAPWRVDSVMIDPYRRR